MDYDPLPRDDSGQHKFPEFGLSRRRRQIIHRLEQAYAADDLCLEDFEHRLQAAERAKRSAQLNALVADFPVDAHTASPSPQPGTGTDGSTTALHTAVWLVPATLLFLALLPLPYGFYMLLRLVVCGVAIFLAYHEYQTYGRVSGWAIALAAVALLFNPLVPVHLTREIWAPIDVLTGVLLLVHWLRRRQRTERLGP